MSTKEYRFLFSLRLWRIGLCASVLSSVVLQVDASAATAVVKTCPSALDLNHFDPVLGWPKIGCQLHKYDLESATQCLDAMPLSRRRNGSLHFVFYGDSRMRQVSENFVMVTSYNIYTDKNESVNRLFSWHACRILPTTTYNSTRQWQRITTVAQIIII